MKLFYRPYSHLHILVRVAVRGPPGHVWGQLRAALPAPSPALGQLLPRGEGVVAQAPGGHHHAERGQHLHRPGIHPQPGVPHTGHGVGELDLDDLPQVLSAGVEPPFLSGSQNSEYVFRGV